MANRTVHSIMHVGWVAGEDGGYRGQMAVLVKPNGRFGAAYMAAIKPFRYLLVYPALLGRIKRAWQASASSNPTATSPKAPVAAMPSPPGAADVVRATAPKADGRHGCA